MTFSLVGYWESIQEWRDGRKETREGFNRVTEPAAKNIAGALIFRNNQFPSPISAPILFHALSTGDSAWDLGGIPAVTFDDDFLVAEVGRQVPTSMNYVKGVNPTPITSSAALDEFVDTSRYEKDGFYDGMEIEFIDGGNAGEKRTVQSYTQLTQKFVVTVGLPATINPGDQYRIRNVVQGAGIATGRVQIKSLYPFGIPSDFFNGIDIREHGLVGGNATAAVDTGFFMNIIRQPKQFKDDTSQLTKVISLTVAIKTT